MLLWLAISACVGIAVILVIWRDEVTVIQANLFGANMHPGCAIVEAVLLVLLAIFFYVLNRAGLLDLRLPPY